MILQRNVKTDESQIEYSSLILFTATATLVKISILLFYRRIFTIVHSWKDFRNWFFIAWIIVMASWGLSWVFAFVFMCKDDVQTLFGSPDILVAKCNNTFMVAYSHSISDFITDILILLIPIPFVWKLQLPTGRKIAVCGIFLLGILAGGSSAVRMAWMTWNVKVGFGVATDEECKFSSPDCTLTADCSQ